jgi:hypothetical protein
MPLIRNFKKENFVATSAPSRKPTYSNMSMSMKTKTPIAKPVGNSRALLAVSHTEGGLIRASACNDSAGVFLWSNGSPVDCRWVHDHKAFGACSTSTAQTFCPVTCNGCP